MKKFITSNKFASAVIGSVQVVSTVAVIAYAAMSVPGVQPAVQQKISQATAAVKSKLFHVQLPACHDANLCSNGNETFDILVVDFGHGGKDPGAEREGVKEADLTRQIGLKVIAEAEKRGIHAFAVNAGGGTMGLNTRAWFATIMASLKNYSMNGKTRPVRESMLLSIHINSLGVKQSDVSGVESFYTSDDSKAYATFLQQSLVKDLGATDHGVHKRKLYVTANSPAPAALEEVGFITNKKERELLTMPEYQQKIAVALVQGAQNFLADKYKGTGGNTKPQPPAEKQPVEGDEVDRAQVTMPEPPATPVVEPQAPSVVPAPKQN